MTAATQTEALHPVENRRPRDHRARRARPRLPPLRPRRRPCVRAEGSPGRRPDPRELYLRHRGRWLRGRLRDARRPREPGRSGVAADRAAGDPDPRQVGSSGRADLPARGRPRHHQHAVQERQPVRRRPRRRPRRLPRHGRLGPPRLPRGRVGAEALDRLPRRDVLPRARRRIPRLRGSPDRRGRRSRRLLAAAAGRRPRGRAQGARLRPHRPAERERRDAHGDDLLLALSEEHPPVGDDRRQPARPLPLGCEDDRRADPPLRRALRAGRVLPEPDAGPGRLDPLGLGEHPRALAVPPDQGGQRQGGCVLRPDGRDHRRRRAARGAVDDRHAALRPAGRRRRRVVPLADGAGGLSERAALGGRRRRRQDGRSPRPPVLRQRRRQGVGLRQPRHRPDLGRRPAPRRLAGEPGREHVRAGARLERRDARDQRRARRRDAAAVGDAATCSRICRTAGRSSSRTSVTRTTSGPTSRRPAPV